MVKNNQLNRAQHGNNTFFFCFFNFSVLNYELVKIRLRPVSELNATMLSEIRILGSTVKKKAVGSIIIRKVSENKKTAVVKN